MPLIDNLETIGWDSIFAYYFDELKHPNLIPARVSSEERGAYNLLTTIGTLRGKVSGTYRYSAENRIDFPVVGDWVAVEAYSADSIAIIHELLPRKTILSRKVAGAVTEKQALAANIDYAFIVSGLDNDFNLRRIERYLTLIMDGGVQPVIILNKADLIESVDKLNEIKKDIENVALGVPIHFISLLNDNNNSLKNLETYFIGNKTVVLLGSSGVGKSTLTNRLLGEDYQKTVEVRISDSKGRHTTTRRQLFVLPCGGMLVDTPGIRELQLWIDEKGFDQSFSDVETLAANCRFRDCTHTQEPGCAVQEAITKNELDANRLRNYQKMQKEMQYLASKQKEVSWDSRLADRKFGKLIHNILKQKR